MSDGLDYRDVFDGNNVANVRVFDRVLSDSEIYRAYVTGDFSQKKFYYEPFREGNIPPPPRPLNRDIGFLGETRESKDLRKEWEERIREWEIRMNQFEKDKELSESFYSFTEQTKKINKEYERWKNGISRFELLDFGDENEKSKICL